MTSSFTQTYCCLRREPHVLCSMLKEMALLASVAENRRTGIETSPNETVNDAIDRAAMRPLLGQPEPRILAERDSAVYSVT